jgi:Transposase domain (DUF772)
MGQRLDGAGRAMGQTGFFDLERRLNALSAKGDPLETIKTTVPWEAFRADIEAVRETKPEEKKSNAGRKPYDAILKFKIVVLQSLYNLSDEQTEFLIRDRFSFMRFLDLALEDAVPDATTSQHAAVSNQRKLCAAVMVCWSRQPVASDVGLSAIACIATVSVQERYSSIFARHDHQPSTPTANVRGRRGDPGLCRLRPSFDRHARDRGSSRTFRLPPEARQVGRR